MKGPISASLLLTAVSLLSVSPASAGDRPAQTDIDRVVSAAASYESGQSSEAFRQLEKMLRESGSQPALRTQLETGLIKLLAPGCTFEARRFACKQLGIIGSQKALPTLAALLNEDQTSGIACLALSTYPPGKTDALLRKVLPAAHGLARIQIINTLGDRRDLQAVTLLGRAAHGSDPVAAEAAIASLGKIGSAEALKTITSLRRDASPALQPALTEATLRCAERLAATGNRPAATALYEELLATSQPVCVRRSAFGALLRLEGDQGEQRVLNVLHSPDATLKPVAIAAVCSLNSKSASERFGRELPSLEPEEQVWMIDSLAARGDAAARSAIGRSLGSPRAAVRSAAINAFRRIGDASAVPLLAKALLEDSKEAPAIESALIELPGGRETDQAIIFELAQSTSSVRVSLISALARRQGAAANSLLFLEAEPRPPAIPAAAFRALARTATPQDAARLLSALSATHDPAVRSEAERAAAQVLAKVENTTSRSALVRDALNRTEASDSQNRASLLALLPGCSDAPALAAVNAAAADPDVRVRDAAVRALAAWPDASAWESLADVYRQPESELWRGLALRGLVRLAGEGNAHPDAALIDRYRQLLAGAKQDGDFKLILSALGGAPLPDALQLALPLLSNAGARAEAEVAVKNIAESIKAQHPNEAREALQRIQTAH